MAWLPPCRIAVSFKMIDTNSGEMVVSANASNEGFSIQQAAKKMARKAVRKIR